MKKNLLLIVLLFVVGICVNDGLKAQCGPIQNQIASACYYNVNSGGDFVFDGNLYSNYDPYGFSDISPIVSNYYFGLSYLRFSIDQVSLQRLSRNKECFDVGVLCKNISGGVGYIRIYFVK
ncbi:MAG: hypothetical protein E6772_11210 [Dysgonomonas sp.]|nr:hypothetical protein [Dysgonomonas sp.]